MFNRGPRISRGSLRRLEAQKRGTQCRRRTERSTAPFKTTGNTVRVEDKMQGQVRDRDGDKCRQGLRAQRTTGVSKQHGRRAMGTVEFAADGLGKLANKQ